MANAIAKTRKNKIRNSDATTDLIINILLVIIAITCIYPIWYILICSVSNPGAISSGRVLLWPVGLTQAAYDKLFSTKQIWIGYRNTIFYTFFGTAINLLVQIPCAYAFSRRDLRGRRFLMFLFTFTMYFGGGTIPTYLLVNKLGLLNTRWSMLLPGAVSAYNIIVARSFFEGSIPESLFDAARIDGSSYTRFFIQVVVPLSGAMIAIISLFCIQAHWNTYLSGVMYLYKPQLFTLQQVIRGITANIDSSLKEAMDISMSMDEYNYLQQQKQLLKYATVIVAAIPMIILYPFIQKFFVKGVMIGAVKG